MSTSTKYNPVPINTIRVTDKAVQKTQEFAHKEGKKSFGLRVAVKGGGCSGLTYLLEIVDGPNDNDKIIIQKDLEVYVPKKAFVFLAGTILDYSDGLNGKGFEFTNPNAKTSCGCGTSFSV